MRTPYWDCLKQYLIRLIIFSQFSKHMQYQLIVVFCAIKALTSSIALSSRFPIIFTALVNGSLYFNDYKIETKGSC